MNFGQFDAENAAGSFSLHPYKQGLKANKENEHPDTTQTEYYQSMMISTAPTTELIQQIINEE